MTWAMCHAFLAGLPDIRSFLERHSERFMREFRTAEKLRADLDLKYRELSGTLRETLEAPSPAGKVSVPIQPMLSILSALSVKTTRAPAGEKGQPAGRSRAYAAQPAVPRQAARTRGHGLLYIAQVRRIPRRPAKARLIRVCAPGG
jgi:hypothetical protein